MIQYPVEAQHFAPQQRILPYFTDLSHMLRRKMLRLYLLIACYLLIFKFVELTLHTTYSKMKVPLLTGKNTTLPQQKHRFDSIKAVLL